MLDPDNPSTEQIVRLIEALNERVQGDIHRNTNTCSLVDRIFAELQGSLAGQVQSATTVMEALTRMQLSGHQLMHMMFELGRQYELEAMMPPLSDEDFKDLLK